LFGLCLYTDSRVGLTEDRRLHNGGHGGVPSSRAPTVPGMTLQCLGWRHSGGDGRAGPEVMEETCSAGLTSRHRPGWVRGRWWYPFRGFHRPLSRGATWRRYGSGRHSVMELTPAFLHSSRTAPAQLRGWPHSAGWWNSAGICFLGSVRGPAWRGFAFDPSARGVPEHLMLWTGE
jgi:hypothetical protein